MLSLRNRISTADHLLELEPIELAAEVLDVAKQNADAHGLVSFVSLTNTCKSNMEPEGPLYSDRDQPHVELAIREAVEELRMARMIVPSDNPGRSFLISRRGQKWQRGQPIS